MTNTIKINPENQTTAIVSKAFFNKALVYGTNEYHLWKNFKKENPEVERMITRTNKKNPSRRVNNRHLTYAKMEYHISLLPDANKLLYQFNRRKELSKIMPSPYQYVKDWFVSEIYNNDMEKLILDFDEKTAESEARA